MKGVIIMDTSLDVLKKMIDRDKNLKKDLGLKEDKVDTIVDLEKIKNEKKAGNRETRRKAIKNLQKRGMTKEQATAFIERLYGSTPNPRFAYEGEKVQLDVARLMSYREWYAGNEKTGFREEYKDWVRSHLGDTFTVEYDPSREKTSTKNSIVQLKEDETNPKWLFWSGDLIRVDCEENKQIIENIKKERENKKVEKEYKIQNSIDEATQELYNREYTKLYKGYSDDVT